MAAAQVEISGAAAPPFFFSHRPFSVFGRKHEQETPQSPDCSLIIPSNEREGARRKTHANCTSSTQPAYGVEPRGWKNPYGTIKLIVSSPFFSFFFFPLTGCICTPHITCKGRNGNKKKKKKEKEAEKRTGDLGRRSQYPFLCVCRGIRGEKEQKRQKKQMDGRTEWRGERRA